MRWEAPRRKAIKFVVSLVSELFFYLGWTFFPLDRNEVSNFFQGVGLFSYRCIFCKLVLCSTSSCKISKWSINRSLSESVRIGKLSKRFKSTTRESLILGSRCGSSLINCSMMLVSSFTSSGEFAVFFLMSKMVFLLE